MRPALPVEYSTIRVCPPAEPVASSEGRPRLWTPAVLAEMGGATGARVFLGGRRHPAGDINLGEFHSGLGFGPRRAQRGCREASTVLD